MARYQVRSLARGDFAALMDLEQRLFGEPGEGTLGPYYVRLCCEFFADSCFVVEVDDRIVGYLLSFVRDRQAYCTTLAMLPAYQGSRATWALLKSFIRTVVDDIDVCWFTVSEHNRAARAVHQVLGAREVEVRADFYGPGDARIISRIERADFLRVRPRLARLGLVDARDVTAEHPVVPVPTLDRPIDDTPMVAVA